MSAKSIASAFAIIMLVSSVAPGSAQETSPQPDIANIPAGPGALAPNDTELRHSAATAPFGVPAQAGGTPDLCENAWDFSKPDAIPGFGTMPRSYTRSLMPRFSGEPIDGVGERPQ